MRTITRLVALLAMSVVLLLSVTGGANAQTAVPNSHYACTSTPGANLYSRFG